MKKKISYINLVVFLLFFIDQISKFFVVKHLDASGVVIIEDLLDFVYVKNIGAAFGIFSGNTYLLIIITFLLIGYIVFELYKNMNNNFSILSFSLILSGALGNLFDRVFRGYVVDFISFTIFGREMAVFNIADIYITFGVFLLALIIIKEGKK